MLDTKWPKGEKLPQYGLRGLLAKDEKVCGYVASHSIAVVTCLQRYFQGNLLITKRVSASTMDPSLSAPDLVVVA